MGKLKLHNTLGNKVEEFIPIDKNNIRIFDGDVIEINKLKDFVLNKASKISKKSSVTLKIGKEAFYKQLDMKLSDAYDYASKVMVQNMLKLDAKEGIDAFIDKREPKWKDK